MNVIDMILLMLFQMYSMDFGYATNYNFSRSCKDKDIATTPVGRFKTSVRERAIRAMTGRQSGEKSYSDKGATMQVFVEFLAGIEDPQHRSRIEDVLHWVSKQFPRLKPKIAWRQPMFTDHGTFIIAFSVAKHHMSVAPERVAIDRFAADILQSGYDYSKELIRIPWNSAVDYSLLSKMIEFNILDKADYQKFWRK
jgi:uncharacterized protein YdhG (YjbR/CyaY superfamily)